MSETCDELLRRLEADPRDETLRERTLRAALRDGRDELAHRLVAESIPEHHGWFELEEGEDIDRRFCPTCRALVPVCVTVGELLFRGSVDGPAAAPRAIFDAYVAALVAADADFRADRRASCVTRLELAVVDLSAERPAEDLIPLLEPAWPITGPVLPLSLDGSGAMRLAAQGPLDESEIALYAEILEAPITLLLAPAEQLATLAIRRAMFGPRRELPPGAWPFPGAGGRLI